MPPYADPLVVNPSAPLMPRLDILDAEIVSIEEHPPAPVHTKEVVRWTVTGGDQRLRAGHQVEQMFHLRGTPPPIVLESRPGFLRRVLDDPYWILMGTAGLVGVGIVGTISYAVLQLVMAVAAFLGLYGKGIIAVAALVIVCSLCAGAKAVCCCCGK